MSNAASNTGCSCGYGGFHEPLNPRCNLNLNASGDPIVRQIVEKLYGTDREDHVYVEVEGHRWCHRHHALWIEGDGGCSGRHDSEDQGRCQPVPLYVEASDP